MVARRTLRVQPKAYKKKSQLNKNARMRLDQAAIDKKNPQASRRPDQLTSVSRCEPDSGQELTSTSTTQHTVLQAQLNVEEDFENSEKSQEGSLEQTVSCHTGHQSFCETRSLI